MQSTTARLTDYSVSQGRVRPTHSTAVGLALYLAPMSRPTSTRLSKTRYCAGIQCVKQLWWRVHEPKAPELIPDAALQAVFSRGHRVGELARERFPGGVLIDGEHWAVKEKLEKTRRAIASGAPAVFEAAFVENDVFVAVDVLERRERGWGFIEVKSTLDAKAQHIPDVAIQLHVLRAAGLEVNRAEVMHLNRECEFPDLSNLFAREDVTAQAEGLLPTVPGDIKRMQTALAGELPVVEYGPHCTDPYDCPFISRCAPVLPKDHVSTLYRIGKRAATFVADGISTITDLPADLVLTPVIARQIESIRTGQLVVAPGIGEALAQIERPTAFLDFETIMPAVPVWPGCHPYEQIAVQMSCHLVGADGEMKHLEFLAEGPRDPRAAIAEAVVSACAGAKTVVAYNASFEKRCIEQLAEAVPAQREALREVISRLIDLLPIVRDHVYHPEFGGSFSLKRVLPALVPGLGYADLDIGEGNAAAAILETLLLDEASMPNAEREKIRRQLLDYCGRDTLAMVKLYERLAATAAADPTS